MRLPSFVSRQQKADGDIGGVDGLFFVSVCLSPHLRPNYSYSTVSVREKQVTCQIKAQDIRPACVLTPLLIFRYTMFWNLVFSWLLSDISTHLKCFWRGDVFD